MKLIKFLFVVILSLVITNVTLTNQTVDEGVTVSDLTMEIEKLENQNTILRAQVASAGSISNLTAKLEALGYSSPSKVAALESPAALASR